MKYKQFDIECPSFADGGDIPKKHTGFGEDTSPEFILHGLCEDTVSLAITMDDLDVPFVGEFSHWVIWNIPKTDIIPFAIPHGEVLPSLGNAVQGIAFGKNRYRGPKQPFFIRNTHSYIFRIYALDCKLSLDGKADKNDLASAMDGHILAVGSITGRYKR